MKNASMPPLRKRCVCGGAVEDMTDVGSRLRERRGWVHAGPVRGARSRVARADAVAHAAGGVMRERATEAISAARVLCSDRLQSAARANGWGADTRISWLEEWAEHDTFSVNGATGLADANAWTAMCTEFNVVPSAGAPMVLRVFPGSRFALTGGGAGSGGFPTILLEHVLVDAEAAGLLKGDTKTLHALHLRARRGYMYAWAGLALYAFLLVGLLYFLLMYLDVAPFSGLILLANRARRTVALVWKVLTVAGYLYPT